jgi:DNA-binding XRE family transcriptional regulator
MLRLIYALKCPFTNNIHYIGKSSNGLIRPYSHLTKSHSEKINEWVESLSFTGHKPNVEVLEYVEDHLDINERELYHIQDKLNKGCYLLNLNLITPLLITTNLKESLKDLKYNEINHISKIIKERRRALNMNQKDLAEKSGIALTVVRKIEQNKTNVSLESLINILGLLGFKLDVKKAR